MAGCCFFVLEKDKERAKNKRIQKKSTQNVIQMHQKLFEIRSFKIYKVANVRRHQLQARVG